MCVSDARCQMPATERGPWGATTSGLRRLSASLLKDTAITRDISLAACGAPAGFQFPATDRRPGGTGFSDSAPPVDTASPGSSRSARS